MFRSLVSSSASTLFRNSLSSFSTRANEGKVAIVTASTQGIGLSVVETLARSGARVVLSSRKEDNIATAMDHIKSEGLADMVTPIQCHVGLKEDRERLVKETIDKFGKIDSLVSNAAANPFYGHILDTPDEAWTKTIDTNLTASFLLARDVSRHFIETSKIDTKGDSESEIHPTKNIVFIASVVGIQPAEGMGVYSVSKAALIGLMRSMALELAQYQNIRVNSVSPGFIKTRFSKAIWANDAVNKAVLNKIPLHRYGSPEEVAATVSFLCSDAAGYIHGENIVVGGGLSTIT